MCDFKDKYGGYFNKAYSFMEKFHGTASEDEWEAISAAISGLNATVQFDINLVVAVMGEIERVYNEGKSKTQGDFKSVYHPIFERVYKVAKRLFFYSQSPSSGGWNGFVGEMGTIQNLSNFERAMAEICIKEFLGVDRSSENIQFA